MLQAFRASPLPAILVFTLAVVAGPAAFLTSYQRTFGYDTAIVCFGTLLVAVLVASMGAALAALALLCPAVRHERWSGIFGAWIAMMIVGVSLIYLATYTSNWAWGDTLAWDTAVTIVSDPRALLNMLPLSAAGRRQTAALVVILLLALVALAVTAGRMTASRLFRRVALWLAASPSGQARRWRSLAAFGTLIAATGAAGMLLAVAAHRVPARMVGEPLSNFFNRLRGNETLFVTQARWRSAADDAAARAAYPQAPDFARKNVVVIMADSLRADRMGVYGYDRDTTPFLSALFAQGHLHRVDMALSSCSESYCGIATTLAPHPFHQVSSRNLTLHGLLKDLGYRLHFFVSGTHGWRYIREVYGAGIDVYHDHTTDEAYAVDDDRLVLSGLSRLAPFDGRPAFFWFFLMSSHVSGTRQPEYEQYLPAAFDNLPDLWNQLRGTWELDAGSEVQRTADPEVAVLGNRYDNGVLQADAMIGRVFAMLQEKGYLADSMVVILGDHGDGLGEHGHYGHTYYLYQEDIGIPLLIYDQDPSVYQNDRFATQIDVAPTVLDRLGLPIPASWKGRSLLQPPGRRVTLHQTHRGAHPCRALVSYQDDAVFKYIRCGNGPEATEELYDLRADPGEHTTLLDAVDRGWLAGLRRELATQFGLRPLGDASGCVE